VNLDATVVFNKPEFAKYIHEETHAGTCGANHFRKGLLRYLRYVLFRIVRLAQFRHHQEYSRHALFSGVEKADRSDRPECACFFQNDLQKEVRTTMLHMHSISPGIAELLLSTSIPCGLRRRTSQSNFTAGFLGERDNLFKFAHFSRDTSSTFGSHDRKLSMMNLVGNPTTEAIAIRASSR